MKSVLLAMPLATSSLLLGSVLDALPPSTAPAGDDQNRSGFGELLKPPTPGRSTWAAGAPRGQSGSDDPMRLNGTENCSTAAENAESNSPPEKPRDQPPLANAHSDAEEVAGDETKGDAPADDQQVIAGEVAAALLAVVTTPQPQAALVTQTTVEGDAAETALPSAPAAAPLETAPLAPVDLIAIASSVSADQAPAAGQASKTNPAPMLAAKAPVLATAAQAADAALAATSSV